MKKIKKNAVTIHEVKKVMLEHLPRFWRATEACLATLATLMLKGSANPTALTLCGHASTGKGTVLGFFNGMNEITYWSDRFTSKAFVSHYANKGKKSLKNIDLIERIKQKCLIVPDMGVIFGQRSEFVQESLSTLTRVLDGEGFSVDSGVHGRRGYQGDYMFSMLGATTPFGYTIWKEMGRFGTRIVFWQMQKPSHSSENDNLERDFKTSNPYLKKRTTCRMQVQEFFLDLWKTEGGFRSVNWKDSEIPNELIAIIANLARLVARLRATMDVWEDKHEEMQHREPTGEDPHRVMSLLLNIARGRALLYGRKQISGDDIPILIHIALSSAPEDRGTILRSFIRNKGEALYTKDVCEMLNVGEKRALQVMANLSILGLVEKTESDSESVGRPSHCIKPSKRLKELLLNSSMEQYFSEIENDM